MPSPRLDPRLALRPIKSVVSASFLYPFKGIWYFCADSSFYPLFGRRLIPLTVTSIVVLGLLFTFTYLPQVAFLAIWHGPGAWFNAVFLVLGEGQILIALLFEALLVDETLVDVFDATLIKEGLVDLVSPSRILHYDAPNEVKMLGKPTTSAVYSPFSFRQIAEFIIFLPLNLIPVIGTPAFLLLTGARAGPLHHWRYFKLRGLTKKERKKEINERKWKYTWFGTVALLLQLVPVLSMFFLLTSAAGSALWVVKLEEQKRLEQADMLVNRANPRANEQGDEEAPPPYTDNPI
ncbi:endo- -beta-xylanase-like protein [Rutstroemia sp. NJR-2017a BBW]|nr:endo- -beta-xylanase-like protein [Rutstroemia sp. NJR-2017a BBW]